MSIFSRFFKKPEPVVPAVQPAPRKDKRHTLTLKFETEAERNEARDNINEILRRRPEYGTQAKALTAITVWARASLERRLEGQRKAPSATAKSIHDQSAELPAMPSLDSLDADELAARIAVCDQVLAKSGLASVLRTQWVKQSAALTRLRELATTDAVENIEWRYTAAYIAPLDAYYSPTKGAIRPKGSKAWEPITTKALISRMKGGA